MKRLLKKQTAQDLRQQMKVNKMMETPETITNSQIKIETALKERKAFDEQSATKLEELKANFAPILDVMEKSGLIGKTPEGKIYMTPKGQEQQIRDFSVSNNFPSVRKFVRFSRNK